MPYLRFLSIAFPLLSSCNADRVLPPGAVSDASAVMGDAADAGPHGPPRKKLQFRKGEPRFAFGGGQPGRSTSVSGLVGGDFDGDGKDDLVFGYQEPHGFQRDASAPTTTLEWMRFDGAHSSTQIGCDG